MAEGIGEVQDTHSDGTTLTSALECAVCLQTCVHPAELPCGHIFCFLCIKGIAFQSGRCAMCRETIPHDFLFKPKLITPLRVDSVEDTYQWYYEGYSGWWQYDQRATTEIEEAYQKGDKSCQLLLAGFVYCIDFNTMVQFRQTNPVRRRRIKRDRATSDKLGVAGLRQDAERTAATTDTNAESQRQTVQDVEVGLVNLWRQDVRDPAERTIHYDSELSSTNDHFNFPRQESDYGVESLGPDVGNNISIHTPSPVPRDGRTFNPRLELNDAGEEDDTDEDEVYCEIVEGPRQMLSGPGASASAIFRPLALRHGRSSTSQDTENYKED